MAPRVVEKREQILQAVILAHDGDGAFRPLKAPAALVDVCGRPALEHALRFVARAGAGEVVIACAPDEATGIQEAVAAAPLSGRDGRPVAVTTLPLAGCESEGDFLRELDQRGAVASDPFILVRGDVVANVSGLDAVVAEHVRRKKKDDADATMTVCLAEAGPRARRLQPLAHDDLLVSLDAKNRVLGWYGGGNARDRAAADLGFVADETYGDAEGLALRSDLIDCHVDVCSLELLFRYSENFDYQASRGHFVPSEVGNAELGQRVYAHVLGATGGRGARVHDPRVLDAVARDVAGGWFAPLTPAAREVRPGVFVGAGVSAPRTAKVSAPAVLGRGSVLAEGAVVDQSFLGEGCRLGEGAVVRGSHVGRGCVVGAGATVDRCLLGAGVVVAPGAAAPRGCVLAEGVVVAKAASLPEFSRVSADSTDEALVGAGGVGCLWQGDDDGFDDDDDGDDAAAVDLMLVFAYVYTKKMLEIDADSPLPPGALDGLSPPFDGERELAEDREVDGLTPTSADYVRGCVSVSWHRTTVAGRYFRVREIADGRIYTARSTPDLEAAKRTKQLFVGL
mmetsp:Transcript_23497/g.70554  ORF Transcript_23497/g.70554 Transcript_23497/m.70554 type:complete len:566 (+) Transcript_23497:215-1912(+)